MRSLSMGITCLAVLCVGWSVNAEELRKQELAARDFSYQGVGIGTTCEDFLKKFPNAQLLQDDKTGVTSKYVIIESDGRLWTVEFFSGKAYLITVVFPKEVLAGVGGTPVLEKKLTDTFGSSTSKVGKMIIWEFPNVFRRFGYSSDDDTTMPVITLIDTAANDQRVDVQARKLDMGF
jgi:hypothetical protein